MLDSASARQAWRSADEPPDPIVSRTRPGRHERPKSAVSVATGALGLLAMAIGLWLTLSWQLTVQQSILLCLVLPALVMIAWEVAVEKVHRRPDSGFDFSRPAPLRQTLRRSAVKLVGIWTTWAAVAALYALLPYYQSNSFQPYFEILLIVGPALVLLSIPYVLLVDRYMVDPYDENWHFGMLTLGHLEEADRGACKQHVLNYCIKAFFLAFMFQVFTGRSEYLFSLGVNDIFSNPLVFYTIAIEILYYIDIVFATIGYALTLKIFGAQIRSPNPLLLGWVAALACYPPFSVMGGDRMISYASRPEWQMLVPVDSLLGLALVGVIVALTLIYSWATVAFGIRFSNLTHRGIITNGPYALTKHPAYIAKNLSWWLVYLPFVPVVGVKQALGGCLSLLIVNGIYYVRAKTEEAHLMEDPTYRAYAAYIAEHGLIARLSQFGRRRLDRRRGRPTAALP
jgi:protein-S-isoprenylcysteine O-methyltransferase Ste14